MLPITAIPIAPPTSRERSFIADPTPCWAAEAPSVIAARRRASSRRPSRLPITISPASHQPVRAVGVELGHDRQSRGDRVRPPAHTRRVPKRAVSRGARREVGIIARPAGAPGPPPAAACRRGRAGGTAGREREAEEREELNEDRHAAGGQRAVAEDPRVEQRVPRAAAPRRRTRRAAPPRARGRSACGRPASRRSGPRSRRTPARTGASTAIARRRDRAAARRGRPTRARTAACRRARAAASTTFRPKIERHEKAASSGPETSSPSIAAPPATAAQTLTARVRCSGGNVPVIVDSVAGMTSAAPRPSDRAQRDQLGGELAVIAIADPAPKISNPMISATRRP